MTQILQFLEALAEVLNKHFKLFKFMDVLAFRIPLDINLKFIYKKGPFGLI